METLATSAPHRTVLARSTANGSERRNAPTFPHEKGVYLERLTSGMDTHRELSIRSRHTEWARPMERALSDVERNPAHAPRQVLAESPGHPNAGGFTLIELLIVVAIIGILAAVAIPNFLNAQIRSKIAQAESEMRSIGTALESYRLDHDIYPPWKNEDGCNGNDPVLS